MLFRLLLPLLGYHVLAQTFPTFRTLVLENATAPYNKRDAPYEVFRQSMNVSVGTTFVVLTKVVEVQQMVSYIANIVFLWNDRRLAFDPEVLGATYTFVPSTSLWIPTVDCFNCNSVGKMDKETDSNEAEVHSNGDVLLLMKVRIDAICDNFGNIEAFPFDKHYCGLDFISKNNQIKLVTNSTPPDLMLGTPEWQFFTDSGTYPAENNIISLRYRLERCPNFYIILLILPTMIITSMVISALTLPYVDFTKSGRFGMGLTGLLALTFLLGIMWNQLPRSKNMPILGRWLLVEEFMVVFCVVIDWPLSFFKEWLANRNKPTDEEKKTLDGSDLDAEQHEKKNKRIAVIIDCLRFVIIFGSNLLTTILMFTVNLSTDNFYQL